MKSVGLLLLCWIALMGVGCGTRPAVPSGGVRVVGRIVDDETGVPLPRDRTWVHGFVASAGAQVTAKPASESSFELVLPGRDVRLRVARDGGEYVSPWEKHFVATGDVLIVEVRLQPTHNLVVRGRILQRDGGIDRPLREGELPGKVGISLHALTSSGARAYAAGLEVDAHGGFVVRVPRGRYRVMTINLGKDLMPNEVDFTDVRRPEHQIDFVLLTR